MLGLENTILSYCYKIKDDPEYSSLQKYGTIANGVGENPLNGNGVPVTDYADGEDIVYSIQKYIDMLLFK